MNNDPYAPPQAVVADIAPEPRAIGPWQVRVAVALCWLNAALTIPEVVVNVFESTPGHVRSALFFAAMAGVAIVVTAFLVFMYVFLGRGYRWARVVFSIVTLLDVLGRIQA